LSARFDIAPLSPIVIVTRPGADTGALARRVAGMAGVRAIGPVARSPRGDAIDVIPAQSPFSSAARDLVKQIRMLPGHGNGFLVTGQTAGELDFLDQIRRRA